MTARVVALTRPLARRRQDLLLASELARSQALGAFEDLAERADAVAEQVLVLRRWLSNPLVWTTASAAGAFLLGIGLRRAPATGQPRRMRTASVLRWAWLVWRLWRSLSPAPTRQHSS